MKTLKKIISLGFAIFCISSTAMIPAFAADTIENTNAAYEVYVDYPEFDSNMDYYKSLARQGYTVIVHVGEEYEAKEEARIAAETASAENYVQEISPREISQPEYYWNVLEEGTASISGGTNNTIGAFFSKWNYYGWTSYEVNLHNGRSEKLTASFCEKGEYMEFDSVKIPSNSTVIKYISTGDEDFAWYIRYTVPCSISGYVARDI